MIVQALSGSKPPTNDAVVDGVRQGLYHPTLGTFDFQADGVARCYLRFTHPEGRDAVEAIWSTGIGKQAPVDEPVLTPRGWRPIGDLRPGDQIFTSSGVAAAVLSVHPQATRETYRVGFSDGSWTRCGPDHLWTVFSRTQTPRLEGARRMAWRERTLPLKDILAIGLTSPNRKRRWRIPMTEAVQYANVSLPMDPYALGLVLGDGHIGEKQVWLTCEKEMIDQVDEGGYRQFHESPGVETLVTRKWSSALRDLGLAGHRAWEKFVPEMYMRAPIAARRALLAGLLDADGSPMSTGGVEFTSTSEALVDAVVELAESLGGSGRKGGSRFTTYEYLGEQKAGRRSWRVNLKLPEQPFRLLRKQIRWVAPTKYPVARYIMSVERVEDQDSVCIRVDHPSGLYLTRHHIVTHNTHLGMGLACLLVEDGAIDNIVVVAEQNKIADWAKDDFPTHTDLSVDLYMGARRKKVIASPPTVLVTTYETYRNDVAKFRARSLAVTGSGPLLDWMADRRTLLIYDEVTRLRGRSSHLHVAHDYALNRVLRRNKVFVRTLGLTATSIEKSPADLYNVARILAPDLAGTVEGFEHDYVRTYDAFQNYSGYKNIWDPGSPETPWDYRTIPLVSRLKPLVIRKRKSDPDVRDQFPKMVEEAPTFVTLTPKHLSFYEHVEEVFADADPYEQRVVFGLLRQIAGNPRALLRSHGKYAQQIVDLVGERGLVDLGCAKEDRLIERLQRLGGEQGVVFTFYGQAILPYIQERFFHEGITSVVNHGGLTAAQRYDAQARFKAGDVQVFLSSDAGAKGLNLGVGSYLCHYELPLMYSTFLQRSNRIHRIDSVHDSVTVESLVADQTIEDPIAKMMLKRNEWSDAVDHGPEDVGEDDDPGDTFISVEQRSALLIQARRRVVGR